MQDWIARVGMRVGMIFGLILLGNFIAQWLLPTLRKDSADRRLGYGVLVYVVMAALVVIIVFVLELFRW